MNETSASATNPRVIAAMLIISGVFMIAVSFGFRGQGATNSQLTFSALSLANVLNGVAMLLSRRQAWLGRLLRALMIVCLGIGVLFLVLLWLGVEL